MPLLANTLIVLGAVCILYCIGILLFVNYGTRFFLVWGAGGLMLIGAGWVIGYTDFVTNQPGWLRILLECLIGIGIVTFLWIEGLIFTQFAAKGTENADYLVVLGAQMFDYGPSDTLRRRLDTAVEYLEDNPDTWVIVSGGRGPNESMTEAQGMYDYLVSRGVGNERIRKEDASGNTYENLLYSGRLLDKENDRIVVVSNNFHIYRALGIARKQGYANVWGLAADSYPLMLPNNLLREFFGVLKDWAVGNL